MTRATPATPPPDAGARHEQGLAVLGKRKERGAYYTPEDVVAGVLDLVLDPILEVRAGEVEALSALRIVDPACGSGNFLRAAAVRLAGALVACGMERQAAARTVGTDAIWGVDLDGQAVSLARTAVAEALGIDPREVAHVEVGDALLDDSLWQEGSFDVVVGNPPFLNQLGVRTARSRADATSLRNRFGPAVGPYTDPAAAFLLLAVRLVRPDGGAVALVEPLSFLSARDAAGARAAVVRDADLTDLWVVGPRVFDASVEVCVPVLVRGAATGATRLHRLRDRSARSVVDAPGDPRSWSHLLADAHGVPERSPATDGTLADIATATADFRDQFYGLAPHAIDRELADDETFPPLVTTGLIDPATLHWGRRSTRFNKTAYLHPRIDLEALPPALRAWAASRLVPKVLLATQTRVLEAVVDEPGLVLPSVPVITVLADSGDPFDLWRIAAVLTSPTVALIATRRHLGSGRSARSMRLRAQEVLALPLPADRRRLDEAATRLRAREPIDVVGRLVDEAYGLLADDELMRWWTERLPAPR